jgi:hypothetical protein
MDMHNDTLQVVRRLILSFETEHRFSPSIESIFHALEHPEVIMYQEYFVSLVENLCPTHPISFTPEGWLEILVVDNPKCYSLIPTNSSPAR